MLHVGGKEFDPPGIIWFFLLLIVVFIIFLLFFITLRKKVAEKTVLLLRQNTLLQQQITDRKLAEAALKETEQYLRKAQKMDAIGTLASGIAHDFNNILSSVIGYAEIALFDEIPKDSPARFSLEQILNAGHRAKSLVGQILTFSRQDENEKKPFHMGSTLKEAIKLLRASIPTTIDLRLSVPENTAAVFADPTRIHQVIINLCANAAYAMRHSGGTLAVTLSDETPDAPVLRRFDGLSPGRYLKLSVSDTGVGMDGYTQERIFEPFFTTKPKEEGTGLGLAVVHGIVKDHGGAIAVDSEVGKGTRVDVLLPACDRAADPELQEDARLLGGNERILLVDDEISILSYSSRMLDKLGYRITAMTDPREALARFQSEPDAFDLIITDLTMPHITGDVLAVECIRVRKDIPIILCTGYSYRVDEKRLGELGIRELLLKPVVMSQMTRTVRRVLGKEGQ